MKSGIAMMLYALTRARTEGLTPAGDIVLALVCDEESGGDNGARFLVEEHPEQFEGVRYAIGEFGGFSFKLGRLRFYPIMVAEKQVCHLKVTFRGAGGHASLNHQDNPMANLARFLQRVQDRQLPVHVTPEARLMFRAIGKHLFLPSRFGISALLNPRLTALTLKLLGAKGRTFAPLFRNTVNPTVVRGGDQINVMPSEVSVELDGRLLPNFSPEHLVSELKQIAGSGGNVSYEVLSHDPGPPEPDMGLFETLSAVLLESDPDGIPVPNRANSLPLPMAGYLHDWAYKLTDFCRCYCQTRMISQQAFTVWTSACRRTPSASERLLSTTCSNSTDAHRRLGVIWPFLFDLA